MGKDINNWVNYYFLGVAMVDTRMDFRPSCKYVKGLRCGIVNHQDCPWCLWGLIERKRLYDWPQGMLDIAMKETIDWVHQLQYRYNRKEYERNSEPTRQTMQPDLITIEV